MGENERKILVVEDEYTNYFLLECILKRYNLTVLHAVNGREAVDIFQATGDIDLILMDIRMPVMDGYEATKQIRQINNKIPIVAITAFAMENDRARCLAAGCTDYLTKPVTIHTLKSVLETYVPAQT